MCVYIYLYSCIYMYTHIHVHQQQQMRDSLQCLSRHSASATSSSRSKKGGPARKFIVLIHFLINSISCVCMSVCVFVRVCVFVHACAGACVWIAKKAVRSADKLQAKFVLNEHSLASTEAI